MKIVICIKPIPDPNIIQFDITSEKLISIVWVPNPTDFCALEEGLKIREKYGGEVVVVSLAPKRGEDILKKALIYGADKAIRVWEDSLVEADTWMVSAILGQLLEKIGFDIVLCGDRSKDSASEFMGVALAERLNLPLVTRVVKLEVQGGKKVIVHKKLDKGERETYAVKLPAVITINEGINQPRYVALFSRAYQVGINKEIEVIKLDLSGRNLTPLVKPLHIGQSKPRTKVGQNISGLSIADMMKLLKGEKGDKKEIFFGSPVEGARKIGKKLIEWLS